MTVPSSHFTRAQRKAGKMLSELSFASLSPTAHKVFRHCFDSYRCNFAYTEQVVLCECVILKNFNLRNKALMPILKKRKRIIVTLLLVHLVGRHKNATYEVKGTTSILQCHKKPLDCSIRCCDNHA